MNQMGYLTVTSFARRLNLCISTVRYWCAGGLIRCTATKGGHYRIDPAELARVADLTAKSPGKTPRRMRPVAFVYFVRAGANGPIKIGFAEDVVARMRTIQAHNHEPIELLATTPGGARLEALMHQRFAADRIHHEWFRPSPELLAHISELELEQTGGNR